MSEQLVLLLLIASTFIVVLIALAIPEEVSPGRDAGDVGAGANLPSMRADSAAPDVFCDPIDVIDNDERGADPGDARRAADVPEEARH